VELWYAAYGSNMAGDRFGCYLAGGCPPGASRTYPGARDRTRPRETRPVRLDGSVYFAWESPTWGGGIAFYDPDAAGESVAVAYRLTLGQFSDVVAQEMHREPGGDLDLAQLWDSGRHALGPGRYESLHVVGHLEELPVVTFTASWAADAVGFNPPAAAYLATMARGLAESHGWGPDRIAAYLLGRPGLGSAWDEAALRALLGAPASPA
jgi:hypothetical protein